MNNFIHQTAQNLITIYTALPTEIQEEVSWTMQEPDESGFGRNEEWQHFSQVSFAREWDKPENAYWDIHLNNPNQMDNNVQSEEPSTPHSEQEQAERVQQMENVIAPLREPLPKDYRFDREEANER